MKDKLNKEEKDLVKTFENDEWTPSRRLGKEREKFSKYAKATLKKDKRINIRISERDLTELQRQAIHEGLPYQTFISSILHKFINGSYKQIPA